MGAKRALNVTLVGCSVVEQPATLSNCGNTLKLVLLLARLRAEKITGANTSVEWGSRVRNTRGNDLGHSKNVSDRCKVKAYACLAIPNGQSAAKSVCSAMISTYARDG